VVSSATLIDGLAVSDEYLACVVLFEQHRSLVCRRSLTDALVQFFFFFPLSVFFLTRNEGRLLSLCHRFSPRVETLVSPYLLNISI